MKKNTLIIIIPLALLVLLLAVALATCRKARTAAVYPSTAEGSKMDTTGKASAATNEPGQSQSTDETAKDPENGFVLPEKGIRPFAVMIDNEGTRSLPQGGLNLAQVIYEITVEGGETRLMPLFWGVKPEMIGPVRSSRHYFLDYAMEHDAIYIHYGWSPMAIRDIKKFQINNIDGYGSGGGVFWDLTKDKGNWQDSYTSMEKIQEFAGKVKYRTATESKPLFDYYTSGVEPSGGQNAEKLTIRYSHAYICGFEYDGVSGSYKRFRKGKPHMERVSQKQLEAQNIIIQYVRNYTIKGDTDGRQEVDTVGSGDGWFVTRGKAVKIKWSKEARNMATRYTDEKGKAIVLNPGQTWIQVLPLAGKVEMQ